MGVHNNQHTMRLQYCLQVCDGVKAGGSHPVLISIPSSRDKARQSSTKVKERALPTGDLISGALDPERVRCVWCPDDLKLAPHPKLSSCVCLCVCETCSVSVVQVSVFTNTLSSALCVSTLGTPGMLCISFKYGSLEL